MFSTLIVTHFFPEKSPEEIKSRKNTERVVPWK